MDSRFNDVEGLLAEIDLISTDNHNSRAGLSHQRTQKLKSLYADDELLKIVYLVDSHVPSLRERASMRYERINMKEESEESCSHLNSLKDIISTKCPSAFQDAVSEMKRQVAEMPKEWTLVQITSQYNPTEHQNCDTKKYHTNGLHISVFNCGQSEVDPFLITVDPASLAGNKLEVLQELMNTLDENNERLLKTAKRKFFKNRREKYEYILKSEDTELTLKGIVRKMEENWLRGWRCLLIGKYQDQSIEQNIRSELENIYRDYLDDIKLTPKAKELLYYVTKGAANLNSVEIMKLVQYCLGDMNDENKIKEIWRLIKELNIRITMNHEDLLRHPVILIIDESLDSLPWEMMEVLNDQPVSRVPSLHFAYFLFKAHEKEIEGGHKIIKTYENGKYVVNPDGDLAHMEVRMSSFLNYWLPKWNGVINRRPTNNEFCDLLKKGDIFSYSGHGNGTHIMTVEMLQKINVKAVVLLFGCASTRIARLGPQVEMYGSYHMYLISRCPCVLGMLWPVTDIYTDILTTEFLSSWIPSDAPIPWTYVDKSQWKRAAKCELFTAAENTEVERANNLDLLRALCHTKKITEHYLTKAACVVRGLPIRIMSN